MRWTLLTAVLGCLWPLKGESKIVSGTADFNPARKQSLITTFACGIGQCNFSFLFKVENAATWKALAATVMQVPRGQAHGATNALLRFRHVLDEDLESGNFDVCKMPSIRGRVELVKVPTTGEYSGQYNGTLRQTVRPHVWYFFIDDCNDNLARGMAPGPNIASLTEHYYNKHPIRIGWFGSMTQADGSHHSYEQWGSWKIVLFELVCFSIAGAVFFIHEINESKFGGGIHFVVQGLNLALMLQLSAIIAEFVDLVIISYWGQSRWIFFILKDIFGSVAQIVIGCVLLFVALGHSLACQPTLSGSLATPTVIVFSIIHLLVILAFQNHTGVKVQFFATEGRVGLVFVAFRILLWIAFLVALHFTRSSKNTPEKVQQFLRKFGIVGSMYFLAFPAVYMMTVAFAPYLRHHVATVLTFTVQFSCTLWLGKVFLDRKGDFFQISSMSQSLLPGGYFNFAGVHRID